MKRNKKYKEIVYAKWIWYEKWYSSNKEDYNVCACAGWQCSNCGELLGDIVGGSWDDEDNPPVRVKYCPNCGALMIEESIR